MAFICAVNNNVSEDQGGMIFEDRFYNLPRIGSIRVITSTRPLLSRVHPTTQMDKMY